MAERPFDKLNGSEVRKGLGRRGLVGVRKIKPNIDQQSLDETVNPLRQGFDYAPTAWFMTGEGSAYATVLVDRRILQRPDDFIGLLGSDLVLRYRTFQAGQLLELRILSTHANISAISTLVQVYERDPTKLPAAQLDAYLVHKETFLIPVINTGGAELEMARRDGIEKQFEMPLQGQSPHAPVLPGAVPNPNSPQFTEGAVQPFLFVRFSPWSIDPAWKPRIEIAVEDRGW